MEEDSIFDENSSESDVPDFLDSDEEFIIPNEIVEKEEISDKKDRIKFATKDSRKYRRKKTFADAPYIQPTEYEIKFVTDGLTQYYQNNPQFIKKGETVESKIKDVMERASKGYICAPKNYLKRIQFITKWNTTALKNRFDYKPNFENAKQIQLQKEFKENDVKTSETISYGFDIKKMIPDPNERKYWQQREQKYRDEFDFNNSSDWGLLLQVLLEELTQFRLARRRVSNPDDDVEVLITDSYMRLIKAQEALGITRKQREAAQNETEGNIAQLVVKYEEKIAHIERIREKDRLEEESKMISHHNRDALKELPQDLAEAMSTVNEFEDMVDILTEKEKTDSSIEKLPEKNNDEEIDITEFLSKKKEEEEDF